MRGCWAFWSEHRAFTFLVQQQQHLASATRPAAACALQVSLFEGANPPGARHDRDAELLRGQLRRGDAPLLPPHWFGSQIHLDLWSESQIPQAMHAPAQSEPLQVPRARASKPDAESTMPVYLLNDLLGRHPPKNAPIAADPKIRRRRTPEISHCFGEGSPVSSEKCVTRYTS